MWLPSRSQLALIWIALVGGCALAAVSISYSDQTATAEGGNISVVTEEADECQYWLNLVADAKLATSPERSGDDCGGKRLPNYPTLLNSPIHRSPKIPFMTNVTFAGRSPSRRMK